MGIKIIKRGTIPSARPIQVTCRNCDSVLEFMPSDVKLVEDFRDGDFYQFDCPVCNKSITKGTAR